MVFFLNSVATVFIIASQLFRKDKVIVCRYYMSFTGIVDLFEISEKNTSLTYLNIGQSMSTSMTIL